MSVVMLDPVTGAPEPCRELLAPSGLPFSLQGNIDRGWAIRGIGDPDGALKKAMSRAPASVVDLLERSRSAAHERDAARHHAANPFAAFEHRASMQSWEECVYATVADGAQILNSTTEAIMLPDFTLPAGYMYQGRVLKYTILGNMSTVITTPGTATARIRWGGVSGTTLATSGAFAPDPTAGSTTVSVMFEFWTVCRAVGASAASMTMGRATWNDFDDATATTVVGNLNMMMIPVSAPAAVNINTLTANALSPTLAFSVATATTQFTSHIGLLEAVT
jgi:hypothetical protein